MQPEFWHERWRGGQIGFHQSLVDPDLVRHWPDLSLPATARVLVPLCGKSLDLLWLQAQGHPVIGVELSDIALQAFFAENGLPARRRITPHCDHYQAGRLECLRGDFFALSPQQLGRVAAVYDRASLVSWAAGEQRDRYVERLTALTEPGALTLLITLEYRQSETKGPPFSVDSREVQRLYARHHSIYELGRRDILASEPRMRARGVSSLVDVCYRLTRL